MTSERPQTMPFLKSKIRVGSCKTMTIDYKYNQQVFHKDDVPKVKRERKEEVLEWARSKLLDEYKPWNKSTMVNKPVVEHRKMENFVRDRSNAYIYNYRSENKAFSLWCLWSQISHQLSWFTEPRVWSR
jgi:hypothetical protein